MPRHLIRRYLPDPDVLRKHKALRPLGNLLERTDIWHMHRRSVARACFVGMFAAFLPIPGQMLVAGAGAVLARCNLPIAVALVWLTNSLTMPPLFYFSYRLGAWLLGVPTIGTGAEVHVDWWLDRLDLVWQPFLLGSVVCGWIAGASLYAAVNVFWRTEGPSPEAMDAAEAIRLWSALARVRIALNPRPNDAPWTAVPF